MVRTRRNRGGVLPRITQTPHTPGPAVPMFPQVVPQLGPVVPMFPPPLPPVAMRPPLLMPPPRKPGATLVQLQPQAAAPAYYRSGSYGCTYKPPLTCDGETTTEPNSITKLMVPGEAAKELGYGDIIRPIDPNQDYFVYPSRSCKRTLGASQPDYAETSKCQPTDTIPDATLLIMPDGGTNLEEFIPPRALYGATFLGVRGLMEGLIKLHDHEYTHTDIKPGNIVANPDGASVKLRYIDFGLLRKHIDYAEDDVIFSFNYPWYSFELRFLSTQYDPLYSAREWNNFKIQSLYYQSESREPTRWTGIIPSDDVRRDCDKLYAEFELDKKTVGSEILKQNDSYSLGRTLEQLYYRLTSHSLHGTDIIFRNLRGRKMILVAGTSNVELTLQQITRDVFDIQLKLSEFSKLWFHMCEGMMHPRYSMRMSVQKALEFFDANIAPQIPIHFS